MTMVTRSIGCGESDWSARERRQNANARFWRETLLGKARAIPQLSGVEIDWMYNQWAGMNATLSNATLAGAWLATLGAAAVAAGLKLTYCMARTMDRP